MLNTRDVEKACRRYFVQGILITAFLSLIVVALYIQFPEWNLIAPMIMTDIFSLTVCIAEALVLRIVAKTARRICTISSPQLRAYACFSHCSP